MADNEQTAESASTAPFDAELNDADDSIVLADLLRSGEASRLRRRGALRVEHHPAPPAPATGPRALQDADMPTWESDDEEDVPRAGRAHRQSHTASDERSWVLFCGGEEEHVEEYSEPYVRTPFSLLPSTSTPGSGPSCQSRRVVKRTNGCGAVVHAHAYPKAGMNAWTSRSEASDAVVPIDSVYFDQATASKIVRSTCGCTRVGIGCAACGNPLGTRYVPCKTAEDGMLNDPDPHSYHATCPAGVRYWHEPRPSTPSNMFVYTFLPSAVSSSPGHTFPARPRPHRTHRLLARRPTYSQPPPLVDVDAADDSFLSRIITSSPIPLADRDEDGNGGPHTPTTWADFTAARVSDDASDKNEIMLFPER